MKPVFHIKRVTSVMTPLRSGPWSDSELLPFIRSYIQFNTSKTEKTLTVSESRFLNFLTRWQKSSAEVWLQV